MLLPNPTTNLAEVAFMVAPEWQGAGLGIALQSRLKDYAVSRGVRGFIPEIMPGTRRCCGSRVVCRAR